VTLKLDFKVIIIQRQNTCKWYKI